jgi:hypothetical protein
MEALIVTSRRSRAQLKWIWNGSGPEILAPIAPNKNEQLSCKKINVMIWATNP